MKKQCAFELNMVINCLRLYLTEIVLSSYIMNVRVARIKRNVEKYIPY